MTVIGPSDPGFGFLLAGHYGPEAMLDPEGVLLKNAPVAVKTTSGSLATLYANKTKTTGMANPTSTDEIGNLSFYAAPGDYTIQLTINGVLASPVSISIEPDSSEIEPVGGLVGAGAVPFTADPFDYGAIGDGQLHPLSERYGTLAAAQVDYPFVTDLNVQIDWAAWVAAVMRLLPVGSLPYATGAAGKGGGTLLPTAGDFQISSPVPYFNTTLIQGAAGTYSDPGNPFAGSVLRPSPDFTAALYPSLGITDPEPSKQGLLKFCSGWQHFTRVFDISFSGLDHTGAEVAACSYGLVGSNRGMGENSRFDRIGGHGFRSAGRAGMWMSGSMATGNWGGFNFTQCYVGMLLEDISDQLNIESVKGDDCQEALVKLYGSTNNCMVYVQQVGGEANNPWAVNSPGTTPVGTGPMVMPDMDPIVKLDSFQGTLYIGSIKGSSWLQFPLNSMVQAVTATKGGHTAKPSIIIEENTQAIGGVTWPTNYSYAYVLDVSAFTSGGIVGKYRAAPDGQISTPVHWNAGPRYGGIYNGYRSSGGPRLAELTMIEFGAENASTPDMILGQITGSPSQLSIGHGDGTLAANVGWFAYVVPGTPNGAGVFPNGYKTGTAYSWTQVITEPTQHIYLGGALTDTGQVHFWRDAVFDGGHKIVVEAFRVVGGTGQPAYTNSWVTYTAIGGYSGARFHKDAEGRVHLSGVISTGSIGASAFTLPTGYRPSVKLPFTVVSNNAFGKVEVWGDGSVVPQSPSNNTWVSLSGISFLGEQ